ncbi:TMEM165/GDT1 family protein [Thalassolituus sp.]|jgi:putative Ca2+/H+ antiporter (TMEM165/GDT1 family)|uniref:TMEM165/GDT1 family protein n=1 Tax=Thalassolituus sp. TaxID=2030822 RepID=UPI0026162001|nr:TMEM165/GDT1 family protein [uncultured Thalassolituus sp.]
MSDFSFLSDSPFVASTLAVTLAEIGDKTQLLSLLLIARFRNRTAIIAGILLATLINHGLSAWGGLWLGQTMDTFFSSDTASWILVASFLLMAGWVLIPDKEDDGTSEYGQWGAFIATTLLFFLAEIGDKTQVATVLLAAEFQDVLWVTAGTTLGMMLANVPVILWGNALMQRLPLTLARYITCAIFLALAAWVAAGLL